MAKEVNIDYKVTFHFVCGKSLDVHYSQEKFFELIDRLNEGWDSCLTTGEQFGLVFSHVTHYVAEKV